MTKKEKKGATVKHKAEQLRPYHFKPGQSGNPAGKPPGRTVHKEVREAAVSKIEEWFRLIFQVTEADLADHIGNADNLSTADRIMLTNVDRTTVDALLDRIVGKPSQAKSDDGGEGATLESILRVLINGGNNGQA